MKSSRNSRLSCSGLWILCPRLVLPWKTRHGSIWPSLTFIRCLLHFFPVFYWLLLRSLWLPHFCQCVSDGFPEIQLLDYSLNVLLYKPCQPGCPCLAFVCGWAYTMRCLFFLLIFLEVFINCLMYTLLYTEIANNLKTGMRPSAFSHLQNTQSQHQPSVGSHLVQTNSQLHPSFKNYYWI